MRPEHPNILAAVAILLRLSVFVVAVRLEIILEIGALRLHLGSCRGFRGTDALNNERIILYDVEDVVSHWLRLQFLCTVPGARRRAAMLLPGKIDHTCILLRLQCYQIEMQLVGNAMDVFVSQRMFPTRVAEYRREILGDMFAGPQQRCKAIFTAGKSNYNSHNLSVILCPERNAR